MGNLVIAIEEGIGIGRKYCKGMTGEDDIGGIRKNFCHERQDQAIGRSFIQTIGFVAFRLGVAAVQHIAIGAAGVPLVLFPSGQLRHKPFLCLCCENMVIGRFVHLVPYAQMRQWGE